MLTGGVHTCPDSGRCPDSGTASCSLRHEPRRHRWIAPPFGTNARPRIAHPLRAVIDAPVPAAVQRSRAVRALHSSTQPLQNRHEDRSGKPAPSPSVCGYWNPSLRPTYRRRPRCNEGVVFPERRTQGSSAIAGFREDRIADTRVPVPRAAQARSVCDLGRQGVRGRQPITA